MKAVGIIAEYNPFHNGHKYQIEQARRMTDADYVIVVMSGSFVQRGTPAWTDKYLRTQIALECGADMVFEPEKPLRLRSVNWSARGYPIRLPEHRHMRCMLQQTI